MPRKNAVQGEGSDAGILLIDDRTKAVMTDQPRHAQQAFREQIARVLEVVSSRSRDDVALVLQYFDGNVDKTIQAFVEDGAKTVLNEWQSHGKKGKSANKRNKKKKRAAETQQDAKSSNDDAGPATKPGSGSSSAQPANTHSTNTHTAPPTSSRPPYTKQQRPPSQQQPRQYQQQNNRRGGDRNRDGDHNRGQPHPRGHAGEGRGSDGSRLGRHQQPGNTASNHVSTDLGKERGEKGHRSHHTPSHDDMAERLLPPAPTNEKPNHIDSELHFQDAVREKKLIAVLERANKDLHRTSVALTRHKAMLQDKLDQSEKSIPKSFDEIQRFLNERKLALTNEFIEVKKEATEMLEAREEQAKELERKTHRAAAMSEEEVLELRAEIKQFVSDRKVDEEIGKALRFTWNPDKLIELIKSFGEVIPVQHHYTTRRPSISSLSSYNTSYSRTTSVSEDHGPLSARSISLTESQDSTTMGASSKPLSPRPANDMDMKAEVAEMAARLQRSLTQGRKGARNQNGPNPDNQGKGDRSHQPNRGQGQVRGAQQPQSNQGQAGSNLNKQGRNQNRQDKSQGHQGSKQGQQPQDQRPQGHRPQGQRPQGQPQQQRNGTEEQQDGQRKENRNAKRRQNRKQRERKQLDMEEASNTAQAPHATSGSDDRPDEKKVVERTNVNDVPVSGPVSAVQDVVSEAVSVPVVQKEEPLPMETKEPEMKPATSNDSHTKELVMPEGKTESVHTKELDKGEVSVEVKKEFEPKMTNGPLKLKNGDVNMNGDMKMNGDVPHVNGDIIPECELNGDMEAPLPQREFKSRRSQKIEEVVKETPTLNGVAEIEPTVRGN